MGAQAAGVLGEDRLFRSFAAATHRDDDEAHGAVPLCPEAGVAPVERRISRRDEGARRFRGFGGGGGSPHPFQVIEGADLGPEDVDDHRPGVDDHPVGAGLALGRRADAHILQAAQQAVGEGGDLTRRAPGGDHHIVGEAGLAVEVDHRDVLGLVVVERAANDVDQGGGVGDIDGRVLAATGRLLDVGGSGLRVYGRLHRLFCGPRGFRAGWANLYLSRFLRSLSSPVFRRMSVAEAGWRR